MSESRSGFVEERKALCLFVAPRSPDRDPLRAVLLPLLKHEQGGVALGMPVGLRGHRGRDQAVTILHQRVA